MAEPEKKPPNENSVHQRIWILALFLSIVVWYGIRAAISFDTLVTDVPIEIQLDEGWTVLERSDETADVRFRGSRGDIRDLNRDQTRIVIDMRGRADAGQQTTRLDLSRIRAPSGVRAVSIRPETLSLSLDREGERQIAVRADLQGAPPEGYEAQQWICTPASVTLRGPMARLEAVDVIRTAVVDLDGRVQSFRVRRP
ncbi:MAG: CdaR family protein, partial [Kiritimatiellia bacterium]|nr:CdaR family protein [Kiritimatiellia bacterium]